MTRCFRSDWRRSGGQAAVEYLVATAALAAALFVSNPSLVEQILTAVQTAYWRMFLALSMP